MDGHYLLNSDVIWAVLEDLSGTSSALKSPEDVERELKQCAAATIDKLIQHRLRQTIYTELRNVLDLGMDGNRSDVGQAFSEILQRNVGRMTDLKSETLAESKLIELEKQRRKSLETALKDGSWKETFRGRDILTMFSHKHVSGLDYQALRDLIVAEMRDKEMKPTGMQRVVKTILQD